MTEIRLATVEDVRSIADLYVLSSQDHVRFDPGFYRVPDLNEVVAHYTELLQQGNDAEYGVLVAQLDGDLIGMAEVNMETKPPSHSMVRPQPTASAGIVVAPNHRRQRVGLALMTKAEAWARERGATAMTVDMLRANTPAAAFYSALGYDDHGALLLKRLQP